MGFDSLGREANKRNLSFLHGNHLFEALEKSSAKRSPSTIDSEQLEQNFQKTIRREQFGRIVLAIVLVPLLFITILVLAYFHFGW